MSNCSARVGLLGKLLKIIENGKRVVSSDAAIRELSCCSHAEPSAVAAQLAEDASAWAKTAQSLAVAAALELSQALAAKAVERRVAPVAAQTVKAELATAMGDCNAALAPSLAQWSRWPRVLALRRSRWSRHAA